MQIVQCNLNANPGEIITFGTYPQTADGTDRTPVKWRVLQNSGSELFVLNEYILDCKRYHGKSVDIKWRDCVDMMDAAYMYMIKRTKITISSGTAKKLAVPGGGCEHKETSLQEHFFSVQAAVFAATRMSVQPVTACAQH